MANLYPACDSLLDSEASRLLALGCFALNDGTGRYRKLKPAKLNPLSQAIENLANDEPIAPSPEFDMLAVDGIAGSTERIENLAQFYRDNGDVLDRRGKTVREAKASPDVSTDSETADRIIDFIPEWAGMPQSQRTPFQQLMIELAAESAIDMAGMQKLIQEQLGS